MTILEMSLGGGVLIAAILLLRRAALYRLPKWAFLLLWGVALCRLLVPLSLPSPLSVFNRADWLTQAVQPAEKLPAPPAGDWEPVWLPGGTAPEVLPQEGWTAPPVPIEPAPEKARVSPETAVYLTGASLCGLFFAAAWLRGLRQFRKAQPAEQEFIRRWQEEHPTLFPVEVKTCGAVGAPVAYGLLRPVILLPRNTDWSDEGQLAFVLTHEYVHIRRGDLFWKPLLAAALCVHWFNPLVWAMFFQANRDLELACDEQVVRKLGLDNRKNYAYALLAAAESGFMPFCTTYKSKNHMEERIRAIMKMKKTSLAAAITAALLVVGVTAVFATSKAPEPKKIDDLPSAVMTNTDPKPSSSVSAPVEKDNPTTGDRIHPITDTPNQASSTQTPETADKPSETTVDPTESEVEPAVENRWNIPADPIPEGTEFQVANIEEAQELCDYLEDVRGLKHGDIVIKGNGDGNAPHTVCVLYFDTKREKELANGYPVNSKGQTYGSSLDQSFVGYEPDLCAVRATNGASGYVKAHDLRYCGYQGSVETLEEMNAYMEWQNAQPDPILIPVYDVNYDNIVGYFAFSDGRNSMTQEEELEMLANQMRKWGNSEEQIARELAEYKASQGWS